MATLLLVDDDAAFRAMLRTALEDGGHQVFDVPDAESALYELGIRELDAVVADIRLPGLDGLELVRELRRRGELPVVAVSGIADDDVRAAARVAGVDAYLVKPVRLEDVERRLDEVLHGRPARPPSGIRGPGGRAGP